ncbi:MAG: hypothetical protein PS018_20290 [bacterium]|nr:hypothetical protein [bacterium]
MTLPPRIGFDPQFGITERGDKPSQMHRDFLSKLDALVAALAAGGVPNNLVNAANDAAAAAGGVAVGNMYRNGSVLMVRVV